MNTNQIQGKAKDIAGTVEEKTGHLIHDKKTEIKGVALQVEGKVQQAWGDLTDAAKQAAREAADKQKAIHNDLKK